DKPGLCAGGCVCRPGLGARRAGALDGELAARAGDCCRGLNIPVVSLLPSFVIADASSPWGERPEWGGGNRRVLFPVATYTGASLPCRRNSRRGHPLAETVPFDSLRFDDEFRSDPPAANRRSGSAAYPEAATSRISVRRYLGIPAGPGNHLRRNRKIQRGS